MYLSDNAIGQAVRDLRGTANHLIKIWFVLKAMGMKENIPVHIDTGNSTPYLQRLFSCGAADGSFFVPFSHTKRFAFMKSDASRSIIQTTVQRWISSGSVVTCDPKGFLDIKQMEDGKLSVEPGRHYPLGLGNGTNGFALSAEARTAIPIESFAVWLFARTDINQKSIDELVKDTIEYMHLTQAEVDTVFVHKKVELEYQVDPIADDVLYNICVRAFDEKFEVEEVKEDTGTYIKRVQNMATISDKPRWMMVDPVKQLRDLVETGETAVVLEGPPRTGKTRAIDQICSRSSSERATIQMHEGWGYENLIIGLFPTKEPGGFDWRVGPLLQAIRDHKKYIVLEEINRTKISQALGEVFSLLEPAYRGEENAIILPNGEFLWIPEDVVIFCTFNNIDTSTEDVDDALLGRMASVHFMPRVEDLGSILEANEVKAGTADKIKEVFNAVQASYELGHGYFASYKAGTDFRTYYLTRIRPVLSNHFSSYSPETVEQIDNVIDDLFDSED